MTAAIDPASIPPALLLGFNAPARVNYLWLGAIRFIPEGLGHREQFY